MHPDRRGHTILSSAIVISNNGYIFYRRDWEMPIGLIPIQFKEAYMSKGQDSKKAVKKKPEKTMKEKKKEKQEKKKGKAGLS